jgi:hypothetical protein
MIIIIMRGERPVVETTSYKHQLVALGDSLTHGFQSLAIYNTDLSFPKLIADQLGLRPDQFRYPAYKPASDPYDLHATGYWGLPLNLELIAKRLAGGGGVLGEAEFGLTALELAKEIRHYWNDRARWSPAEIPAEGHILHNLAVAGYDLRDLFERTADVEWEHLNRASLWEKFRQLINPTAASAGPLMGLKVLNTARVAGSALTPVEAARQLGLDGGIETLIVFIGANNALRTVVELKIKETGPGYDSLEAKGKYNLWLPEHFGIELTRLMERIKDVNARRVLWGTVPHVTIAPIAHGIGGRLKEHPQYFEFYTYPWIDESRFHYHLDPSLTGIEVMRIDTYIDKYNDLIRRGVQEANRGGQRDWRVVDICAMTDKFAYRRYWADDEEPQLAALRQIKLPGLDAYPLPNVLREIDARGMPIADDAQMRPPDSRFFESGQHGRTQGGLVALDGVHPTTIGYGMIAAEFMKEMQAADVRFERTEMNWLELLAKDELMRNPPARLRSDLRLLGKVQPAFDWVAALGKSLCSSFHGRGAAGSAFGQAS